jgi:hypothetical protein
LLIPSVFGMLNIDPYPKQQLHAHCILLPQLLWFWIPFCTTSLLVCPKGSSFLPICAFHIITSLAAFSLISSSITMATSLLFFVYQQHCFNQICMHFLELFFVEQSASLCLHMVSLIQMKQLHLTSLGCCINNQQQTRHLRKGYVKFHIQTNRRSRIGMNSFFK